MLGMNIITRCAVPPVHSLTDIYNPTKSLTNLAGDLRVAMVGVELMTDVRGFDEFNNHGWLLSPTGRVSTPSKWPNSMAYKWWVLITNWDDPPSRLGAC